MGRSVPGAWRRKAAWGMDRVPGVVVQCWIRLDPLLPLAGCGTFSAGCSEISVAGAAGATLVSVVT